MPINFHTKFIIVRATRVYETFYNIIIITYCRRKRPYFQRFYLEPRINMRTTSKRRFAKKILAATRIRPPVWPPYDSRAAGRRATASRIEESNVSTHCGRSDRVCTRARRPSDGAAFRRAAPCGAAARLVYGLPRRPSVPVRVPDRTGGDRAGGAGPVASRAARPRRPRPRRRWPAGRPGSARRDSRPARSIRHPVPGHARAPGCRARDGAFSPTSFSAASSPLQPITGRLKKTQVRP